MPRGIHFNGKDEVSSKFVTLNPYPKTIDCLYAVCCGPVFHQTNYDRHVHVQYPIHVINAHFADR
jgi:hypothetical protein